MNNNSNKSHAPQRRHGPMGGGPPGSQQVEKAKDAKGALKKLVNALGHYKILMLVIFVLAASATVFSIYAPKVSTRIFNEISDGLTPVMEQSQESMGKMMSQLMQNPEFVKDNPELAQKIMSDTLTAEDMGSFSESPEKAKELFTKYINSADLLLNPEKYGMKAPGINFDAIMKIIVFLIGLYLLSFGLNYSQQLIMAKVTKKFIYDLRNQVNRKLSRLPLSFFDKNSKGDILSRVANDIDNLSTSLQNNITQLISAVTSIIGIIIMMLTINIPLTLISLATIPFCLVVVVLVASKSRKHFGKQWEYTGNLNGHVEEMYTGHKVIQAFSHEDKSIEEFNKINEQLFISGKKAQFISGIIMPLMGFINNIGYILICVVGGFFVSKGSIKIGDISAFVQYTRNLTQQVNQSSNIINTVQSAIASAERVFNLLEEPEEVPETTQDIKINEIREIRFEDVEFYYNEDKPVINKLNLTVKQGETIAIIGPTGAGKTTIVNLLMRFYDVVSGRILINGIDIRDLKREELRNIFGMVLQDTWLFTGTIEENIGYSKDDFKDEEVKRASKSARSDHFINTLPENYATILEEEGSNISQGEKQLLTIARAFMAERKVLILDEATSSVDTRTEILIQKAMTALMKGKTSFVIAHRLSTIRDADTILVLNNGDIVEQGNHESLLAKGGLYHELYHSQFVNAD